MWVYLVLATGQALMGAWYLAQLLDVAPKTSGARWRDVTHSAIMTGLWVWIYVLAQRCVTS